MVGSKNIKHYIQLIRPVNIAVLALTILLFRFCIIDVALYRLYDFQPYLNDLSFYILLLTTIFVTAGGYVINDIFDTETDAINKPGKNIIGDKIDDDQAFNYYLFLSSMGVVGSFALMFTSGQMKISTLPIFIIILLYVYASTFKKMMVIGNIVVSICAALPILFLSVYELRINPFDPAAVILFTQGIGLAAVVYGFFAFLTTWIRELIKDVEDMEGDDYIGARTLPIVIGIKGTKALILFIQLLTLSFILAITYYLLAAKIAVAFYGIVLMLILPLVLQIGWVIWATTPKQFKWASLTGKVHMVLGVLTLLYFSNGTAPYLFDKMFNFFIQVYNSW